MLVLHHSLVCPVRATSYAPVGSLACLLSVCPLPWSSVSLRTLVIISQDAEARDRTRKMPLSWGPAHSYGLQNLRWSLRYQSRSLRSVTESAAVPSCPLFQEVEETETGLVMFISLSSNAGGLTWDLTHTGQVLQHGATSPGPHLTGKEHTNSLHA